MSIPGPRYDCPERVDYCDGHFRFYFGDTLSRIGFSLHPVQDLGKLLHYQGFHGVLPKSKVSQVTKCETTELLPVLAFSAYDS